MDQLKQLQLKKTANNVRFGIIESVYNAACGHPGGSLSIADILTYLYFVEMKVDPKNPKDEKRDRFVLSKGHTAPALYSVLAERGFFPKEELKTLRKTASRLQGHPDMKGVPGVDMSTGSLGLESLQLAAWRFPLRFRAMITEYIQLSVTARARKVKYGKQPCLQLTTSLTILWQ